MVKLQSVDSISKLNVSESKESNLEESQPLDMATIWDAVLKCDLCDVLLQVKNGADPDEMDDEGRTPLMVACAQGGKFLKLINPLHSIMEIISLKNILLSFVGH